MHLRPCNVLKVSGAVLTSPIVGLVDASNRSVVKRSNRELLPTLESPTSNTCAWPQCCQQRSAAVAADHRNLATSNQALAYYLCQQGLGKHPPSLGCRRAEVVLCCPEGRQHAT